METKPENPAVTTMLGSTNKTASKEASNEKLKKETSLLIGRLLSKKEVQEEVLTSMKEVSDYGELVSFGYLMGRNKGIRKRESEKINSKLAKRENLFLQSLEKEISDHKADYPIINDRLAKKAATSTTGKLPADGDPFSGANLQLYSPYNEVKFTTNFVCKLLHF
nr:hypothetical protein [uncultured Flavobacterium sp.]